MPNLNTYIVAGISFYKGAYRLRTSNNLAERQKTLLAMGDTDINLIELPRPMTKIEIVKHLSWHIDFDTEEEKTLLAQLREKWHIKSDVPLQVETELDSIGVVEQAPAPAVTRKDPNWEPDF